MGRSIVAAILFVLISCSGYAQGESGKLLVISHFKDYQKSIQENGDRQMVELKKLIPGIIYDLRYAGSNNFMGTRMYPAGTRKAFLRKPAALALLKLQQALEEQNLGMKIFDAYRPWSVTKKFWEMVKDERYVANPSKGSNHNRGIAVDVTIVDLKSGMELNMGTGFDNFSDSAHVSFAGLPKEIVDNRLLLKSIMEQYGFRALETEWWHFTYQGKLPFEVLDIPFRRLK